MSENKASDWEVLVSNKKPVSVYAAVALAILNRDGEVVVKGIGSAIRKVVDVSEFIKNKFGNVSINYESETVEDENGKKRSMLTSTIKKN